MVRIYVEKFSVNYPGLLNWFLIFLILIFLPLFDEPAGFWALRPKSVFSAANF